MTAPQHDREPGQRRKPYSKPRNARRDAVLSARAALALTWVPPALSFAEQRRLRMLLVRERVRYSAVGERATAAEMQRLFQDVVRAWNTPREETRNDSRLLHGV